MPFEGIIPFCKIYEKLRVYSLSVFKIDISLFITEVFVTRDDINVIPKLFLTASLTE